MNPSTSELQQTLPLPPSPPVTILGYFTDDSNVDYLQAIGSTINVQTITLRTTCIGMKKVLECQTPIVQMRLLTTKNGRRFLLALTSNNEVNIFEWQNKSLRWCRLVSPENNYVDVMMKEKPLINALIAMDPINGLVLLHTFSTVFRLYYWTNDGQLLNYFDVSLPVKNVQDMAFVQSGNSKIVFLCRGGKGCFIQHVTFNLEEKVMSMQEKIEEEYNYETIVGIPSPTFGYLLVGPNKISYRHPEKGTYLNLKRRLIMESTFKLISVINFRTVFLLDSKNRLLVVDLDVKIQNNEHNVIGLIVKLIEQEEPIEAIWHLRGVEFLMKERGKDFQIARIQRNRIGEYEMKVNHQEEHSNVKPRFNGRTEQIFIGECIKNRFRIESKVACGVSGDVYKVFDETNETAELVLKLVLKSDRDRCNTEIDVFSKTRHIEGIPKLVISFQYKENFCIVQKFAGESLKSVLARNPSKVFSQANICRIGFSLMKTLSELHKIGFMHRDLHDQNVLLHVLPSQKVVVKLIDFGCARRLKGDDKTRTYYLCVELGHSVDLLFKLINVDVSENFENRDAFLKTSFDSIPIDSHWLVGLYQIIEDHKQKSTFNLEQLWAYFRTAVPSIDPMTDITYELENGVLKLE